MTCTFLSIDHHVELFKHLVIIIHTIIHEHTWNNTTSLSFFFCVFLTPLNIFSFIFIFFTFPPFYFYYIALCFFLSLTSSNHLHNIVSHPTPIFLFKLFNFLFSHNSHFGLWYFAHKIWSCIKIQSFFTFISFATLCLTYFCTCIFL